MTDAERIAELERELEAAGGGSKAFYVMPMEYENLKNALEVSDPPIHVFDRAPHIIKELRQRAESAEAANESYKRAWRALRVQLGLPPDHESGEDLQVRIDGLCAAEAAQREAEAKVAELRAACEWVISTPEGYKLVGESSEHSNVWVESGGDDLEVATTLGVGWKSPEEHEAALAILRNERDLAHRSGERAVAAKDAEVARLQAAAAAMRACVQHLFAICRHKSILPPMDPGTQERFEKEASVALADDAGRELLDELQRMRDTAARRGKLLERARHYVPWFAGRMDDQNNLIKLTTEINAELSASRPEEGK